jgi:hypothetical protein
MVKLRQKLSGKYFDLLFLLFMRGKQNTPHCIVHKFHIITPGYNNAGIQFLCRKDHGKCENCEKKIVEAIHVMNL